MILRRPSPTSSLADPTVKPHSFSKPSIPIASPSISSSSNPRRIQFLAADAKTLASRVATGRRRWTAKPSLVPLCAASNPPSAAAAASDGDEGSGSSLSFRQLVVRVGEALSMAFPLWVGSACVLALWRPSSFVWVHRNWQITGITLTMLGMGMTLTLEDLRAAFLMPKELTAGFVLQYTVMPLSGFFVSKLLKLPSHYAAGLILVACCPGGTASNIVTYLARGNVALSVLMTAASTFAAVIMTPILTSKLAGQFVAVDPAGLFMSTVQVVLAPVLLGALLNQYCNSLVEFVSPLMPFVAVATVAILCGSAIAQNASAILSSGLQVVLAVCLLHCLGFTFGYLLSRTLRIDVSSSRTISIEVGMQNSVLGVVLAGQHFGNPLTAVPCAVSSICHSVYGSLLAGIWRSMPPPTEVKD
ncbi:probable sodium/metabolite cotransporter BASS1, chloroplastic [Phoenix dactylifera]|uniref:Probable sodium/metabolite cotransporter BASS1, chloroplastic n=1 Tax=Phoenix dactylifera TaxID=42345 RepID=A0A8B7C1R9_PHODC|nr:probable sodium/metabolite cotransporter BASS1, chloroplastic [Phoenix dactylifera]XP_008789760.1 probable sodium/metabolite cotransporter BASS1, chloroplastic [Phoenix dactylifera]